jgi:spore cortex formation protein SpoVR/YcgB (stage V sporulation)
MDAHASSKLLFNGPEWDFDTIHRINEAVEKIALGEMGLDVYRTQIEVIGAEQMLDAYASTGMPLFYKHWSFGKHFSRNETFYRRGWQQLAYEIVINSNPCVCYVMEENSATMQAIVIAHAAFGHNHFFKNNYVFKQWTDADGILDYLAYAKTFIAKCEDRHGLTEVERLLDAAHALQGNGIHRYPGKRAPNLKAEEQREAERRVNQERMFNDLWRTLPERGERTARDEGAERRRAMLRLPEENILYFLEKTAPRLAQWQREILRIVRIIAQYFYPQRQTKLMNEGCATYVHHRIMTRLHDTGQISDGAFMEFLHSHSSVVMQPDFDDRRFGGINPYALGFAMMEDIERICTNPTEEDREWFPDIVDTDPMTTLKYIWANFRDESFVGQFLSPAIIRKHRLFQLVDQESEDALVVGAIHDLQGYREIRRVMSRQYDVGRGDPDIQIVDVDLAGERVLELRHQVADGATLDPKDAESVLRHLANLWGYRVQMVERDDDKVYAEYRAEPTRMFN